MSGAGGAYNFSDTAYFVKHEENGSQLSLYYSGNTEGTYPVGTETWQSGKGFITYTPNSANSNVRYLSVSGSLKITKIEGKLLSGTFSGSLQKVDGTEKIEITNGSFTAVNAVKI